MTGIQNQAYTITSLKDLDFSLKTIKILENEAIDWEENCIFDGKEVIGFRVQKATNSYNMLPIPNSEIAKEEAREMKRKLDVLLKPATSQDIALMIKKLSLHCGMQAKSPAEVNLMLQDYVQDLADLPALLLERVCADIRKSPDTQYLPSSGKIIERVKPLFNKFKSYEIKVCKILGIEPTKKPVSRIDEIINDLTENLKRKVR